MDDPIVLSVNDRIEGKIAITRNKLWRRHLRICISFYHITEGTQSNVSEPLILRKGLNAMVYRVMTDPVFFYFFFNFCTVGV